MIWGGLLWSSQHREQREQREAAAAQHAQDTGEPGQAGCIPIPVLDGTFCAYEEPGSEAEQQYTASDLQAQQDMAGWAFAMFVTAAVGALITLAGVIYVAMTLHETRKATGAAEKAAKAAHDANIGLAEHSRRELRAYVQTRVLLDNFVVGGKPRLYLFPTNTGATPARDVEIKFAANGCGAEPEKHKFTFQEKGWGRSKITLGAGIKDEVNITADAEFEINDALWQQFTKGGGTLVFGAAIRYRDIFGIRRWTLIRGFVRHDPKAEHGAVITAGRKNNYAT